MGFEEQLQSISKHLPSKKQTLFFSATIPPKIETLAIETLHNPLFITVGTPNSSSVNVRHTVLWVEEEAKKKHLFTFLKDKDTFCPPVIIFVNSRKGTLLLAEAIDKHLSLLCVALGIFTGLIDLLEPLGVDLPPQLLHHRQNEAERRRRKRMLQDDAPKVDYHKKESLLSLIQSSSKWKH
uniref:Helicase ATP-binding domain-containing protein n=1 Tax=Amphimedon queenslandica TaxID=400682 RepID=A0A1X7SYX7_AMPQE